MREAFGRPPSPPARRTRSKTLRKRQRPRSSGAEPSAPASTRGSPQGFRTARLWSRAARRPTIFTDSRTTTGAVSEHRRDSVQVLAAAGFSLAAIGDPYTIRSRARSVGDVAGAQSGRCASTSRCTNSAWREVPSPTRDTLHEWGKGAQSGVGLAPTGEVGPRNPVVGDLRDCRPQEMRTCLLSSSSLTGHSEGVRERNDHR